MKGHSDISPSSFEKLIDLAFEERIPSTCFKINLKKPINLSEIPTNIDLHLHVNNVIDILSESIDYKNHFNFGKQVLDYVNSKYNFSNSLGIHVRLLQKADFMRYKISYSRLLQKSLEDNRN